MPTPTHSQPHRRPGDLFTNRHRAKAQFEKALDTPQAANEYRILVWAAPGGQGKTALLEEFERILARRNDNARNLSTLRPGFALIDFNSAENRSIATALLSIREKLAKSTGMLFFPAFDAAYLRYMSLTQPGISTKDLHARLFSTGSDTLDAIMQAIQAGAENMQWVPGFPGFGLVSKFGAKATGKAARAFHVWWQQRGESLFSNINDFSHDALLRKLPSYLGLDLMNALAAGRASRLVILFDTYEALWRGHGLRDGLGSLRIDDWVQLLVQDAQGVLFVVSGRNNLHWDEIDPAAGWREVIEFHPLGGLTQPDAQIMLRKWDILEPDIRARMIAGAWSQEFGEVDPADNETEACLPFYLQLQAQTYDNIKGARRVLKLDDFGGEQPQILARFLEHLDIETDRLMRVASYPGSLDPAVLDMLADRFLGGRASVDWSRLYAQTLVSEERDGERFLHDLLRRGLQERERRERAGLYADIHQALFAWFDERCGAATLKTVSPEQERALLAATRHLARVDERAAVRWANRQMQRLDDAALWRALEEVCQLVLPLAETAFEAENEWTAAVMSWLASVARTTGRYAEAEQLFERVGAFQEKTLGSEHPSFAPTLHNLACVYSDTGRYAEAERLYEQARAIYEKTLGPEHPSFATTLHNLAGVYRDTGRYAEAERLYEQVRAIQEKTLGPEHPSFATTLGNLAGVYSATGRYAEAERLYERVQAIDEKTLGPEHPSFAPTLHNLAGVYRDTGRYAEAERLYEQVRAIQEKTLGPEHPSFATTLHNLAGVYSATGRYAEAERLYEQARAIQEKTLGPEHPSFAPTLHNLAGVYRDTGRYAEAERLYEQVRAIQEKTLGPEHPSFATTLHNLAGVYSDTGRYAEAERLYEQVRAILEKTLGPEHPSFATTLHNLAGVYRDTGRYAEAERLYEQVRAILEKTLGPEHPWLAVTLGSLGCVYGDTGRFDEAEQLFATALHILTNKLPPRHPRLARMLVNRGRLRAARDRNVEAQGDLAAAISIFETAGVEQQERWHQEARDSLAAMTGHLHLPKITE